MQTAKKSLILDLVAFGWGLAEATLFFIVPDVLLTAMAVTSVRSAIRAGTFALAGALIGGLLMWQLGATATDEARALLDAVPAISPALIAEVQQQYAETGLPAVALGPTRGIPYKIYAVEWGSRGGSLLLFLIISVPARYLRFLLTPLLTRFALRSLSRWTGRRKSVELALVLGAWSVFYTFYFLHFR